MQLLKRTFVSIFTFLTVSILASTVLAQGVTITEKLERPAKFNMIVEGDCSNRGPSIRLGGELSVAGVGGQLIFSNNHKGTHTHEEAATLAITLLESGQYIQEYKSPAMGGAGGNPHIFVQLHDNNGSTWGSPIYLGRCVQGLMLSDSIDLKLPMYVTTTVSGECTNSPGPTISLNGSITLGGLGADIIFVNSLNSPNPHDVENSTVVSLQITPKKPIEFSKSPHYGGAGGNPLVLFSLYEPLNGISLTDSVLLGRCNKL